MPNSLLSAPAPPKLEPILVPKREAARACGFSERKLFDLTWPKGPIPCVRVGTRVLYRPTDLVAFAEASKNGGSPAASEAQEVQS